MELFRNARLQIRVNILEAAQLDDTDSRKFITSRCRSFLLFGLPDMGLEHLRQLIWAMAVTALAIALSATAVIQLLKDLFPIRRRFQRNFLSGWFSQRLQERSKPITTTDFNDAERDLIHLATGGDGDAFYDLEPSQLCGQMNSAAQIALAYPDRHPALLRFLAPEADNKDLTLISQRPVPSTGTAGTTSLQQQAEVDALLDARNRVTHHLQRSIDALQISMSFRWKFYVQILIYIICFIASFVCLFTIKQGRFTFVEAVVTAVVAGFLSPVVSDFAAAVNRWRQP
jgi:hypothetical protein